MKHAYLIAATFAGMLEVLPLVGTARPDAPGDAGTLPIVKVIRGRAAASWENLGGDMEAAFGFDAIRGNLPQYRPRDAARNQAAEHETRPWGVLCLLNGLTEENVLSGGAFVLGVEAIRNSWTPPPNELSGAICTPRLLWHWDAPKEMRLAYPRWTDPIYRERYAALCGVLNDWATEPKLWLFDATSGPKWEAAVPFRATYEAYCARTGQAFPKYASWGGDPPTVYPAVAHDGSRVLVWAGWQHPRTSFLFVYDGKGQLIRTTEAPGYWAWPRNGGVMRSPTEPLFALRAHRRDDNAPGGTVDEYFLVNGEGNFLGRFVDDMGKPVAPMKLSNTHAYAQRREKDGTYTEFIIRLAPGSP